MARIGEIETIDAASHRTLSEAGINTTEELLERARTRIGRAHLAEETGLGEHQILQWANRADLMRLAGVGKEYSDLLESAGVDSPLELRHRRADHLSETLAKLNEEKHLVERVPGLEQVEKWIEEAKALTTAVEH